MRRFLTTFLLTSAAGLLLIGCVNLLYRTVDEQLVSIQKRKLEKPADILFVGDSSLGNSLNADCVSRLTGARVVNAALTGAYSVPGSLELIKQYIARHGAPREIWIVQAVDVMQRQIDLSRVSQELSDRSAVDAFARLLDLRQAVRALKQAHTLKGTNPLQDDYIRQAQPLKGADIAPELKLRPISASNRQALEQIAVICRQYGISCTLAIGPNSRRQVRDVLSYKATLPRMLPAPIRFESQTPFWITDAQLGDSPNHVHPRYKLRFSERWACVVNRRSAC